MKAGLERCVVPVHQPSRQNLQPGRCHCSSIRQRPPTPTRHRAADMSGAAGSSQQQHRRGDWGTYTQADDGVFCYTTASFRLRKNFNPMNIITFVLFDKYCPIVDQLGSKDSSRDFQLNYVISFFYLHLIFHTSG